MGTAGVCRYRGTQNKKASPLEDFDGGHIELPTLELCMVWGLYRHELHALDWRVWLACRELVERRKHTGRRPRGRRTKPLTPSYTRDEVRDLVGGGGEKVRDSLARLRRVGLVHFHADRIEFAKSPDQLAEAIDLEPVFAMAAAMPEKRSRFPLPQICWSGRSSIAPFGAGH